MSVIRKLITQIESLSVEELCEALEYNGYGDCVDRVRCKSIDGQGFLKLNEVQVSMWRLTPPQMRRLWSFIEHVRQNPSNFVLVPKKAGKVFTPPTSNFSNVQNNFQTHSLGRPPMKPKPQYVEKNKIENFASTSENRQFSSLSKEDSKSVKGRLEDLFKADLNQGSTFLHNIKPSLPPKSPINNYVEENNNHEDDDDNDYLHPISMEPPINLRSPPVENKNTFLNKTRKLYENPNFETELHPPAGPNYKTLPPHKRPLPTIPRKIAAKPNNSNSGYLPPISIEPPTNIRSPPVENKNNFLNQTRKLYENHEFKTEVQPPAGPNYKTLPVPKRPLPEIPREIVKKPEPPKFQHNPERQNSVSPRPAPKTASIFRRPMLPMTAEWQNLEEPEEELGEYTPVIEEEPVPSKRPLPAIPIEDDEDSAEYGTISEEEEDLHPTSAKHQFKHIDPHLSYLSQPNTIEEDEDLVYEPVPDVIEKKEKFSKLSNNLASRPLPAPPIVLSRPNQRPKEERRLPAVPISFNRPNQKVQEKPETVSDSDEESVLSELMKMSKTDSANNLSKSRSPINLPKPPPVLPNPPQFDRLNVASNNILFVNNKPEVIPKDDFDKETYYREIDRKGAKILLEDLEVGTFLVRPSRDEDYICTISIAHSKKTFNVGVQRDPITGIITLGSIVDVEQPDFRRLQDLINYYCVHPLCLAGQLIVLKNILPFKLR